jgi:hypothetical protein
MTWDEAFPDWDDLGRAEQKFQQKLGERSPFYDDFKEDS